MGEMTDRAGSSAEQMGQQAQDSDWLDKAIRAGLICYGVVHLLIGVAGAPAGLRRPQREGLQQGGHAGAVAEQPYGEVLVWAIAIGMFLLVLWRLLEAVLGPPEEKDDSDRWKAGLSPA